MEFVPERWYSKPEMVKNKRAFSPFGNGECSSIGASEPFPQRSGLQYEREGADRTCVSLSRTCKLRRARPRHHPDATGSGESGAEVPDPVSAGRGWKGGGPGYERSADGAAGETDPHVRGEGMKEWGCRGRGWLDHGRQGAGRSGRFQAGSRMKGAVEVPKVWSCPYSSALDSFLVSNHRWEE
jgi:hypothetical protein